MFAQLFLCQRWRSKHPLTIEQHALPPHLATCGPTAGDKGDDDLSMFSCDLGTSQRSQNERISLSNLTRRIVPDSSSDSWSSEREKDRFISET
eukprot:758653-Hanusia_phi.AAC.5